MIKENKKERYWWAAAFIIIFISSILYAARKNVTEFYFDSKYYWNLTNDIFYDGPNPLNILRFPKSIRGYFFPVLTGYFKYFFHGVWGWRILASLSLSFCFSLSLPYAVRGKRIGSLRDFLRTLLAFAVFMWFWGDSMQYPLSDFSACFYLLSAIAFLRSLKQEQKAIVKLVFGFAAGVLIYASYNTRQTFLYGGMITLIAFLLINRKNKTTILIGMSGILIGMTIFALPQCYINNRHEGSFSPLVNYDLVENEVYKGLTTSRYETYVGDFDIYPRSGIIYDDITGWRIIQEEKISADNFQLSKIFELFMKYPLDMIGIYVRHLFSLLTPVYRTAYITDIYALEPLTVVLSIFFWLIAGFSILEQIKERSIDLNALWVLAVCIPGLLQIFDEPELRFFLPIYLLCYYHVFAEIDYKKLGRSLRSNWPQTLAISLVIIMLWISVTGNTLATKRDGALLFRNDPSAMTGK